MQKGSPKEVASSSGMPSLFTGSAPYRLRTALGREMRQGLLLGTVLA